MPKKSLAPQTILFPLPAVMVSCQKKGEGEKPNIITLSWVGVVCSEPPMLGIGVRRNRFSWDLIAHSKGFVVNIPTGDLLKATDFCGMRSGKDVNKFAEAKLTPVTCAETGAPLIKECPVNLECELKEMLELGSHTFFIGQIDNGQQIGMIGGQQHVTVVKKALHGFRAVSGVKDTNGYRMAMRLLVGSQQNGAHPALIQHALDQKALTKDMTWQLRALTSGHGRLRCFNRGVNRTKVRKTT